MTPPDLADDMATLHRVQQFLHFEARLLDERRLWEWLELFDPDARYWVPMAWGQTDPVEHVSLCYEDVDLLKMRIRRLEHEGTASQLPPSRSCHLITNTTIDRLAPDDGEVWTRSAFTMVEYRRDEQRWFAGFCRHQLREEGDSFRIRHKRVDLLDCDSDAGHLRFGIPF